MTDGPLSWPTVTAVVPTRSRPLLLRRAVESILGQSYPGEIECLVVFDRSSPVLPDVRERPNRRLRVCVNDRTPGLPGTRNSGIVSASGEFIAFCDDDDEWLPEKLRLQIQ